MARDEEWLQEADGYEPPSRIKIESVPRGDEPAAKRCAELLRRAHREPSRAVKKAYGQAALAFALADEEGR